MNKNLIAVTIGDIKGIGIQLLIRLWKKKEINNFILITNYKIFLNFLNKKKIKLKTKKINNLKLNIKDKSFLIYDIKAKNNLENTYKSLIHSYHLNKNNFCSGVITLPINKSNIINKIDKKFIGQTELYEKLDNKKISNMIFYSEKFIITSLTTHIPINKINEHISKKKYIIKKILSLKKCLNHDFNIKNPKLLFLGLNPHAGESGKIGFEESKYIEPIIKKLKLKKIYIDGPISADSAFNINNLKYYDCFISTYHDQALIPFKIINKFNGVNYTGSLDIIRVSPDHGTGYKHINSKHSNDKSIKYCFKVLRKILKNRSLIV